MFHLPSRAHLCQRSAVLRCESLSSRLCLRIVIINFGCNNAPHFCSLHLQYCPAGRFVKDLTSCERCPSARYAPAALQDSCINCEPGYSTGVPSEATSCTICEPGSANSGASYNCTGCGAGYFANSGYSKCIACAPGTYNTEPRQHECIDCPAGRVARGQNSTNCTDCQRGAYQGSPGQSSCPWCEVGRFSNAVASDDCADCPVGRSSESALSSPPSLESEDTSPRTECFACVPGKHSNTAGQSACTSCLPGRFTAESGSEFCAACSSGRFSNPVVDDPVGAVTCKTCDAGKVQPGKGQAECILCDRGKSQGERGQLSCESCPGETFAFAGSTSCSHCVRNFFSHDGRGGGAEEAAGGDSHATCVECPTGTTCAVTGKSSTEDLELDAGFWRITASAAVVHECPMGGSACRGGSNFSDQGASYCNEGYMGPLCDVCSANYFYDSEDNTCNWCTEEMKSVAGIFQAPIVIFCLCLIAFYVLYVVYKKRFARKLSEEEEEERQQARDAKMLVMRRKVLAVRFWYRRKVKPKVKALLSFFGIVGSMGTNFVIEFPGVFNEASRAASYANLSVEFNFACSLGRMDALDNLVTQTALPMLVGALILAAAWRAGADARAQTRRMKERKRRKRKLLLQMKEECKDEEIGVLRAQQAALDEEDDDDDSEDEEEEAQLQQYLSLQHKPVSAAAAVSNRSQDAFGGTSQHVGSTLVRRGSNVNRTGQKLLGMHIEPEEEEEVEHKVQMSKAEQKRIMRVFRLFDKDGSGSIDRHELLEIMIELGADLITTYEIDEMIEEADVGDGEDGGNGGGGDVSAVPHFLVMARHRWA